MPSVTIDAGVLAAPPLDVNSDEVHQYVEMLLDWTKLLDEPWVAIYMSEQASEVLFADGIYPLRNQLRTLFTSHGIVEYDVNTVAQVVDRLLQLTPHFETYFKIRDVLMDEISTTPDILQICSGANLKSDLARCIVLFAILRRHCRNPIRNHSLILRQVPRQVINVRALVYELDHERDDIDILPTPPEVFEGDVLVCDNFRGFIECLDESAVLLSSQDSVGFEAAIRIAIYKARLNRGAEANWKDVGCIRIGQHFHNTLTNVCINNDDALPDKILRAILETIDGENMAAVHALRTGPGGNDPHRMRGRDKAMRRDIDREYHLHYWDCIDGAIELASIVTHNDFSIPE